MLREFWTIAIKCALLLLENVGKRVETWILFCDGAGLDLRERDDATKLVRWDDRLRPRVLLYSFLGCHYHWLVHESGLLQIPATFGLLKRPLKASHVRLNRLKLLVEHGTERLGIQICYRAKAVSQCGIFLLGFVHLKRLQWALLYYGTLDFNCTATANCFVLELWYTSIKAILTRAKRVQVRERLLDGLWPDLAHLVWTLTNSLLRAHPYLLN